MFNTLYNYLFTSEETKEKISKANENIKLSLISVTTEDDWVLVDNNISKNVQKKMEDSWYITPPPCYIIHAPMRETDPLENLLIAYPNISLSSSILKEALANRHTESTTVLNRFEVAETHNNKKENEKLTLTDSMLEGQIDTVSYCLNLGNDDISRKARDLSENEENLKSFVNGKVTPDL